MRRIIITILLLASLISLSGQARNFFYRAPVNVATSSTREDIHYLFNNDNTDETANGYDFIGTNVAYTTTGSPPEGTHWLDIGSRTADYFQLPTAYTTSFPSDFSISFFFETAYSGTNEVIIESGTAGTTGFAIRMNTTGQDLDVFTNSTELNATNFAGFSPSINTTFHIMVTYESSTGYVYIYVDGVEENDASPEAGTASITLTNAWYIMNTSNGNMDDFRVIPELLDATDATWLMNNAGTPLP